MEKPGRFDSKEQDSVFDSVDALSSYPVRRSAGSLPHRAAGSGPAESSALREARNRNRVFFITKAPKLILNLLVLKYHPFLSTLIF